jgi:hypothetical protein
MCLVEIEYNPRNGRGPAVLASAHTAHPVGVNILFSFAVRDGAGKVEQNPVWIDRGFNRWLHRRTQRHFHSQAAAISCYRDVLYSCGCPACALRQGARHQEHARYEMFADRRHIVSTLASAPIGPALPLV